MPPNMPWWMYTIAQYNRPTGLPISPMSLAGQGEITGGYPSPVSLAMMPPSSPGPYTPPTLPTPTPAVQTISALQRVGGSALMSALGGSAQGGASQAGGGISKLGQLASKVMGSPITALAPAAFQTGLGIVQLAVAALKRKPDRPVYQIPEEIKANAAEAQQAAQGFDPATRLGIQEVRQQQGDAAAMIGRNVGQAASVAALIGGVQANANRGIRALTAAEYQSRIGRQQLAYQNRRVLAQYKDKAFQVNKMQPYQDAMRTIAALTQGGLLNINTGLTGASGAAQNIMALRAMMSGTQTLPWWMTGTQQQQQ